MCWSVVLAVLLIIVGQYSEGQETFRLSSNVPLIPYHDADDGQSIAVGDILMASIDFPFDLDYFIVALASGDRIEIAVDSLMIDAFVSVDFVGADDFVSDDDSGGGVFGTNAN